VEIAFGPGDEAVLEQLLQGRFAPWRRLQERLWAEREALAHGFDRLLCLAQLDLHLYEHQREAVTRVLREMRGRALLADEVGLGKTIEAGVIAKEYMVRGLARKLLVLAPASLLTQWHQELNEKLGIPARINRSEQHWDRWDCIITSLDTARRSPHAERIQTIAWDVVIVDEAHRLKNRHTVSWRFVDGLRKKYLLLLTATPIQNDLTELYSLFTLLKPGLLRTYSAFRREFMLDRRAAKHPLHLRERLREVMVRSTRRDALLRLPRRVVETVSIPLSGPEQGFYHEVLSFARSLHVAARGERGHALPLILLLRELCSSPAAAARTLRAMATSPRLEAADQAVARRLAVRAAALSAAAHKLAMAADWIGAHQGEPVLVFTEFRATQAALAQRLQQLGVPVALFHGGLTREERAAVVDHFRHNGGVLISTEAGGEGQNLQFCRIVLNYDLPWNPMRVEQRIGRVHRLGQTRDVLVVNLVAPGTIEDHVYRLLHEKIGLFRQVIGDLDLILADEPAGLEGAVGRIVLESANETELKDRLADLGLRLERERQRWEAVQQLNAALLDESEVADDAGTVAAP